MISIKNLSKSYGSTTILKNITVDINDGDVISIIGPSGTGKSTFLRCLNLLEEPTTGSITINGTNLMAKNANIPKIREKMGMVFQHFNLFPHLTVLENITLAPMALLGKSKEEATQEALSLLKMVGLTERAAYLPEELSGGQQQRIAIARTLAMKPEIILFDEPTSALDPTMVGEVLSVIRNLAKTGITMLIVTHEMHFARDVSTRIFFMEEGGIYEDGSTRQIFENPKRTKTRAFVRRLNMFTSSISKKDFDLYHLRGELEQFFIQQMVSPKNRNAIHLVIEELLENILLPRSEKVELEVGISPGSGIVEIRTDFDSVSLNPLTEDDEKGRIARLIIKKRSTTAEFTSENGTSQITLKLFGEQR